MKPRSSLLLIGLFLMSNVRSQTITLHIDKFQTIKYPIRFTDINEALRADSIVYLESGGTDVEYIFNIDDSLLVFRNVESSDTLRITYYNRMPSGGIEIWGTTRHPVETPGRYHYLITSDPSNNPIFICRWVDGNEICGWFAPSYDRYAFIQKKE